MDADLREPESDTLTREQVLKCREEAAVAVHVVLPERPRNGW